MLLSARELTGYTVLARDGRLGTIEDFHFNSRDWVIQYVIVNSLDWPIGRWLLMPPSAVERTDLEASVLLVNVTKGDVKKSPCVDTSDPVSRRQEIGSAHCHESPTYWDRFLGGVGPDSTPVGVQAAKTFESHEVSSAKPTPQSAKEVFGFRIFSRDGEVGLLEDLIVESETWAVNYLLLLVTTRNWPPGGKALLAPCWITCVARHTCEIRVDLKNETIRNSPEFSPEVLKR